MATGEKTFEGPLPARLAAFAQTRRLFIEGGAIGLSIAILLLSTIPNLANHPTITDDEMWVFSAAVKLAREGVFGTDMFTGFYHADTKYFFNMPLHHVSIAAALKLLGAGIVQARLVGVAYAIATMVLTYLIARKLYGVTAAIMSLWLLLFLRMNIGFDTGLPLQETAVNMRYDLAPVPFVLGGVLVLLGGPTLRRAAMAGALFGVAVLMQFYGFFILPIAALFLLLERLPAAQRLKLVSALALGALAVGLPYGIYILSDLDAFKGQAGTIDRRADFHDPGFYIDNLRREPDRFIRPLAFKEVPRGADHFYVDPQYLSLQETLTRRPSAKLAVLVGLPLALAYTGWRAVRLRSRGDALLCLCLGGLVAQYALLESAKYYIYWIPVVPFLCIGMGAVVMRLLQPPSWSALRLAAAGVTAGLLLIVFAEGAVARLGGIRTAPDATNYEVLADKIHEYVPAGSRVVGSTSLWWGMRDTEYRSYFQFFYLTREDAGPYRTTISGFLEDFDAEYLVLTRLAAGELETHLSARDFDDYQRYMRAHATHVTRIEGPVVIKAYGFIDIWKLD